MEEKEAALKKQLISYMVNRFMKKKPPTNLQLQEKITQNKGNKNSLEVRFFVQ